MGVLDGAVIVERNGQFWGWIWGATL